MLVYFKLYSSEIHIYCVCEAIIYHILWYLQEESFDRLRHELTDVDKARQKHAQLCIKTRGFCRSLR